MTRVSARIDGAGRRGQQFRHAAGEMRRDMERAVSETAQDAELIFAAHAPRRSGRLARGVSATSAGTVALVRARAVNPASGFDYVRVTRFGHRTRVIRPVRAKALKIPAGRGFVFRRSVRGYRPSGDWAERALPDIERDAQGVVARIGRGISVRIA